MKLIKSKIVENLYKNFVSMAYAMNDGMSKDKTCISAVGMDFSFSEIKDKETMLSREDAPLVREITNVSEDIPIEDDLMKEEDMNNVDAILIENEDSIEINKNQNENIIDVDRENNNVKMVKEESLIKSNSIPPQIKQNEKSEASVIVQCFDLNQPTSNELSVNGDSSQPKPLLKVRSVNPPKGLVSYSSMRGKKLPVIVITGVRNPAKSKLEKLVEKKGGKYVDKIDDNVTHIVAHRKITITCVIGIIRGLWIMPTEWISKGRTFCDETVYQEKQLHLFKDKKIYFSMMFLSNETKKEVKDTLITVCS